MRPTSSPRPTRPEEEVILAQTGTKLNAIGKVVIEPATGNISSGLVTDYAKKIHCAQRIHPIPYG